MYGQIKSSFILSQYKKHTKDSGTSNETNGKVLLNHYYMQLLSEAGNYSIEKTKYGQYRANQRSYLMPPDYISMKTLSVKVGDKWTVLTPIMNSDKWKDHISITRTGSTPEYYTISNQDGNLYIEIDPIPVSDGAAASLEIVYEGYHDRLLFPADYTTGNVSITQGSANVTGAGGATFTSAMVGRFLQVTDGKSWYDIKTFTSSSAIALVNFFQEDTVATVGYTIAELLRLPEEFSLTPIWGAAADYYRPTNAKKSKEYQDMFDRDMVMLRAKYQHKTKGRVTQGRRVGGFHLSRTPLNYPNGNIG